MANLPKDFSFIERMAEEAKKRATLMAAIFNSKLEYFKNNNL